MAVQSFRSTLIPAGDGYLIYREEKLTGFRARICPGRLNRGIRREPYVLPPPDDCPFCPGNIETFTPLFPDGKRITRGECTAFPNLFPFAQEHMVAVVTTAHAPAGFSPRQISDALIVLAEGLSRSPELYPSINWNFLPSSGASLVHPHMQGLADSRASPRAERYIGVSDTYLQQRGRNYWDCIQSGEEGSERWIGGEEIGWHASPVPAGEKEIRGLFPFATAADLPAYADHLAEGIAAVIRLFHEAGSDAFNMSIFLSPAGRHPGFRGFCSLISRINPDPLAAGDSSFMERLHLEPIILTLPEDLGLYARERIHIR